MNDRLEIASRLLTNFQMDLRGPNLGASIQIVLNAADALIEEEKKTRLNHTAQHGTTEETDLGGR